MIRVSSGGGGCNDHTYPWLEGLHPDRCVAFRDKHERPEDDNASGEDREQRLSVRKVRQFTSLRLVRGAEPNRDHADGHPDEQR